jgi:hypothetical protein
MPAFEHARLHAFQHCWLATLSPDSDILDDFITYSVYFRIGVKAGRPFRPIG